MPRLGRLPWINTAPIFSAIDRGLVACPATTVTATAAELNDLMAAGSLDVSAVSAVEYARAAHLYHLLPDLAISSDGPVHSVALFSRKPVEDLNDTTVLLTASSRTSVLLLQLLCRRLWQVAPRFAAVRAEAADLSALSDIPHDAVLVIGDAALHLKAAAIYPVFVDLGSAWKNWTGLPFVFAVWAARRDCDRRAAMAVHRALIESREWGVGHLDIIAEEAAARIGIPVTAVRAYLGNLDYRLDPHHLEGLSLFFRMLAEDRVVPDGSFTFLTAA